MSIHTALLARYPRQEFALLAEVGEAVGWNGRHVDYMVLNLWRSRGLELQGFEVKSSRSDWLREKKDPSKAEALAKFCDRFWLVVAGPGIVKADELPSPWGLLELKGEALVQVVPAPKLDAQPRPWAFTAELVRRAQDEAKSVESNLRTAIEIEMRDRLAVAPPSPEAAAISRAHEALLAQVRAFEEASGVSVRGSGWHLKAVGEAVRFITEGGMERQRRNLENLHAQARQIAESIGAVLDPKTTTEAA